MELAWTLALGAATRAAAVLCAVWLSARCLKLGGSVMAGFAGGLIFSLAAFDLLPEALEEGSAAVVAPWCLGALLGFGALDVLAGRMGRSHGHRAAVFMGGIGLHNIVDGVLIAGAAALDTRAALVAALAVMLHELPQDVAEIAALERMGMRFARAAAAVAALAALSLAGISAGNWALSGGAGWMPHALALSAGCFLYVSLAELLPAAVQGGSAKDKAMGVAAALLGAAAVFASIQME